MKPTPQISRRAVVTMLAAGTVATAVTALPLFVAADSNILTATCVLNVREQPSTTSKILGVLAIGEQVERRGDPQGDWTPVRYKGQDGWVYYEYTKFAGADSASAGTATANEDVNVRRAPTTLALSWGVLKAGQTVQVTGDTQGGWAPVNWDGKEGWVYSAYLTFGAVAAPANSAPAETEAPAQDAGAEPPVNQSMPTGTAVTTDHLNVRSGPGTQHRILGVLPKGTTVETRGGSENGWTPVIYQGQDGYCASEYLATGEAAKAAGQATTSTATGSMTAVTALNVRSGPGTSHKVLGVLSQGEKIDTRGDSADGWTPVIYQGQDGFCASEYLTSGEVGASSTAYTTTAVNLRTGPGLDYEIVRVLGTNTAISLTGVTQDGWSQVDDGGTHRWISSTYIAAAPVSGGSSGETEGPASGGTYNGSLNTGGSSGLDELRETTKQVVHEIRQNFPAITTMYGVRADPLPDHPSGRAVDLMMPNGANDVSLGDSVASYLQANAGRLNIEYLIWRQRIWITGDSDWTWMADRGGTTANHYDHVHVTVNY